jgi:hypothetical protein
MQEIKKWILANYITVETLKSAILKYINTI